MFFKRLNGRVNLPVADGLWQGNNSVHLKIRQAIDADGFGRDEQPGVDLRRRRVKADTRIYQIKGRYARGQGFLIRTQKAR